MRKSYFKKLDQENNIEIPQEFLKKLGINENDELEIIVENNEIKICKLE